MNLKKTKTCGGERNACCSRSFKRSVIHDLYWRSSLALQLSKKLFSIHVCFIAYVYIFFIYLYIYISLSLSLSLSYPYLCGFFQYLFHPIPLEAPFFRDGHNQMTQRIFGASDDSRGHRDTAPKPVVGIAVLLWWDLVDSLLVFF